MLTRSDANGLVKGTIGVQARAANIPLEDAEKAMGVLTSPDPNSRTQEEEGRRIIQVAPNLWSIVNHEYYRDLINYQSELEKSKVRSKRYREKRKQEQDRHGDVTDTSRSDHDIQNTDGRIQSTDEEHMSAFSGWWDRYPKGRKIDRKKCERKFNRLSKKKQALAAGDGYQAWLDYWATIDTQFIPHPHTWLNNERWDAAPPAKKKSQKESIQVAADLAEIIDSHKKTCENAMKIVFELRGSFDLERIGKYLDELYNAIARAIDLKPGDGYRLIVEAEDLFLDRVADELEIDAATTTERRKLARSRVGLPVLY